MKLLRIIPILVVLGVLGTAVWGAATSLQIQANSLTAGSAIVSQCDDSGVQIYWRTEWNKTANALLLKGVTVAGIDSDCAGQAAEVVVTDKAGAKLDDFKTTVPTTEDTNIRIEFTKCAPGTADPTQHNCMPRAQDVHDIHIAIHN